MKKSLLILGGIFSLTLFSCDDFYFSMPNTLAPGYTVEELIAFYSGEKSFSSYAGNIIHIPFEKLDSIDACIDNTMDQQYIDASIAAIAEYNKFDYVNITYILSNYCAEQYMIFGQYDDQETDYCSDDDSRVVACNLSYYNLINGQVIESKLMYNNRIMQEMEYNEVLNTAVHEVGHTFGLVDLYEDEFAAISIMYYQTSEYIFTELTQFDIDNLNWFYKR
jgi:predicted Zn-dependent protease